MDCASPVRVFKNLPVGKYPDGLSVPCGKCLMCRIAKRREWSARLLHESEAHNHKVFITLTYSDDFIPENNSLVKKDYQLFMKMLRYRHEEKILRYFAVGEYGEKTLRPHYHAIIFGIGSSGEDKDSIEKSWSKGFIKIGNVEFGSIDYVARYMDKKYMMKDMELGEREKPFQLFSKGLGLKFAESQKKSLNDNLCITIRGAHMAIPRYYIKKELIDKNALEANAKNRELDRMSKETGIEISEDDLYLSRTDVSTKYFKERRRKGNQREKNLKAKHEVRKSNKL